MHASNTARPSSAAHPHAHSLSDPPALLGASLTAPPPLSASTLGFYDASPVPDWQYAPATAHPSLIPNPDWSPDSNDAHPHVALRAASPQSMVSSGSASGDPPAASSPADATSPARVGKKQSIDRNRKPCGACSSSKRKCKVIPTAPNLCERCRNHGLSECPPHISWTTRKASLCDSGSLSPLDTDERELSSRSASPSYFGAGRSPVGYPAAAYQNEHGMHANLSTTQEWVQAQTDASGSTSTVDVGAYEPFYAPQNQNQNQPHPNLAVPHFVQQDVRNAASFAPPVLPVCHVCQTPYNEFLVLNYALALSASSASPPYELDQAVLNAYGHIPPTDATYENSY